MKISLKRINIGIADTSIEDINISIDTPIIIGRGLLLKCGDKTISRKVGILIVKDGSLFIQSTNSNPLYVTNSLGNKSLLNGDCQKFDDGDKFGLLEDSFWYQICIPECETGKDSTSNLNVEIEKTQDLDTGCKGINLIEEKPEADGSTEYKNRCIPKWMQNITKSDSLLGELKEPKKRKIALSKSEIDEAEPIIKKKSNSSPVIHTEIESVDTTYDQSIDQSHTMSTGSSSVISTEPSPVKSTDPGPVTSTEPSPVKPKDPIRFQQPNEAVSHIIEEDIEVNVNNNLPTRNLTKREKCPYGAGCYRKNPSHWKELAHPNDSDYKLESEEDENDKPECEFGKRCYRKNVQHRKDFKHTCKRQPKRKAKLNAATASGDDSEEDYDDMFIDDSSDNYCPSGSETESDGH